MFRNPANAVVEKKKKSESARPDNELLIACRQGDAEAWAALLEKYERLVFSIARNHGLSQDDSADITQIAFTALIQSLDSLRDDSNLGGWLATVTRRHCWRLLARRRREGEQQIDPEIAAALLPGAGNDGGIERWELAEWLHGGLARMGGRCRDLLIALYFDPQEPSYADVAAHLGMAEGSIGPTRARCLKRLKEMLGNPRD